MARGIEGNEIATPRHKPTLVKQASTQSSKQQKSLLGFFRKAGDGSSPASQSTARTTKTQLPTPHASHESVGRSSPTPADLPGKDTNKENGLPDQQSKVNPMLTLASQKARTILRQIQPAGWVLCDQTCFL